MLKFNSWRHKTLIYYLKTLTTPQPLQSLNPFSPFSLQFSTTTSDSTPFPVTYLINNFGFSPQFASKLSSTYRLCFKNSDNPDSVLTFFRNHGFSDSQLRDTIAKLPALLSCDPSKRVLPKIQFLLSKGASNFDIVNLISKNPRILSPSLENHIVPTYELVYRFMKSDKDTIARAIRSPDLLSAHLVPINIRLLIENGVADMNIARLIKNPTRWSFNTPNMLKFVEELKDLGFDPSKIAFGIALEAKLFVNKKLWKLKVDVFKKWGWSDDDVKEAFRRNPHCIMVSIDKINLVMNFWVNQMGWDVLALVKNSLVFSFSFEKKIIPRAPVVQFLLKNGLWKKNASLTCPFVVPDKRFLDMFIKPFKESSYLLKLYEEKLNLAYTTEQTCMP